MKIKLFNVIERFSTIVLNLIRDAAKPYHLSVLQAQCLMLLIDKEVPISYLVTQTGVRPSTMSVSLNALERKGFITRHLSELDKRSWHIALTPQGKEVAMEIQKRFVELLKAVESLSSEESNTLYFLLLRLISRLWKEKQILRTCFTCRFFEERAEGFYCSVLQQQLSFADLQWDCPDHRT